jgi:hypothetical protein
LFIFPSLNWLIKRSSCDQNNLNKIDDDNGNHGFNNIYDDDDHDVVDDDDDWWWWLVWSPLPLSS